MIYIPIARESIASISPLHVTKRLFEEHVSFTEQNVRLGEITGSFKSLAEMSWD